MAGQRRWRESLLLDTGNYCPHRDGRIAQFHSNNSLLANTRRSNWPAQ
jgi:hypothetical protein